MEKHNLTSQLRLRQMVTFEKVSFEEYHKSINKQYDENFNIDLIQRMYDEIKIPSVATFGSSGYDFRLPFGIEIERKQNIVIPTGIRICMPEGYALLIFPKSGTGTRYRLSIVNTVPVIDSDYSFSDNQGHIFIKMSYDGLSTTVNAKEFEIVKSNEKETIQIIKKKHVVNPTPPTLIMNQGDGFAQGVILQTFNSTTDDLNKMKERNGGFSSTGR